MSAPAHERQNEEISAFTETEEAGTFRLRGFETDDGWQSAVEVVEGEYDDEDAHVTTLFEGSAIRANQIYNQTIEPFLE